MEYEKYIEQGLNGEAPLKSLIVAQAAIQN